MARLNHVKSFRGTSKTEDGNLTCGSCREKIRPGDGYRWWANRAPGSRGSFRNIRCMKDSCTPSMADRTPGRAGEWMRLQEALFREIAESYGDFTTTDEFEGLAASIADQVRDFAQEFIDGAENMESGFGHATYQSDELRERGEQIEAGADDIEQVSFDDPPGEDDSDEFDEDEVGAKLSQEMFGLDDPEAIEDDQDRSDWQEALQAKRDEHEAAQDEDASEEEMTDWRENAQQSIIDALDSVDIGG